MDVLIQRAKELAQQQVPPYIPIQHRVAYVVSHGQSYASNGYAIRTQGIAKALNEHGLETLCFIRQGRPWELAPKAQIDFEVTVDGVRYFHSPWPAACPANEVMQLELAVARLVELFTVYRPAAVLAASNFIVGLPAWVAAQQLGLPFYNEVRGFWELSRDAREPGYAKTADFKIEASRDTFVAKQALKVFTLNQPMKAELVKRGVAADTIELVPNGVSKLPEIKSANPALKKQLGIADTDKVIGYIGSFNAYEGLETLIDACAQLVKQGERVKLLLVGDSQPVNEVNVKHKDLVNKPWFIQVGRVGHEQVGDYYALLDAVVIPRRKMAVCDLVPPMKAAEALAYAKRLILSDVDALKEYAKQHPSVATFMHGNSQSLVLEIQKLLKIPVPKATGALMYHCVQLLVTELKDYNHSENQHVNYLKDEAINKTEQVASVERVSEFEAPISVEAELIPLKLLKLSVSDKEFIHEVDVATPSSTLELSAAVIYNVKGVSVRKAVLLFDFFDKDGNKIQTVPGIGVSAAFKQHFRYLNETTKDPDSDLQEVFKLKLKAEIVKVVIYVAAMGLKPGEEIDIKIQGKCYNEEAEKEQLRQKLIRQPLPAAIVHRPDHKRMTSDLTIACVLDEFTAECMSHEVNLIKVTQEGWQTQLEQNPPDFLLVESCWRGNDDNWGTLTKGSGGGKKLSALLKYCKTKAIPTVFWNKEDPPHYDKFGPIAALFDLAITTDANMVPRYKTDFGIDVYPLSFAAQPVIHNPEPTLIRLNKAVFAGSYYGDKPKRCADFNEIMQQVIDANIGYDIFDRNFGKKIAKFEFPDRYQANIVGNLVPEDVWKAHKGYKYQINMNSVQDSPTMFARRVYESLASGTPVISNDSLGVRELFGKLVIMPDEHKTIAEQLQHLESSPAYYRDCARRGVRAVMRDHTYGHRIKTICQLLGIDVDINYPKGTLAVKAESVNDVTRAKELFALQTAPNKHLFIELSNFDSAYKYLNQSDSSITFAMALAHDFYTDESHYYGSNTVLKHSLWDQLAAEALEDYTYWKEV